MQNNEERKLSGAELKALTVDGSLPEEYVSEENVRTLLNHEIERMVAVLEHDREQVQESELFGLDTIIRYFDILVRKYIGSLDVVNRWEEVIAKAKGSMGYIDRNREAVAADFMMKMFNTLGPTRMREEGEQMRKSAERLADLIGQVEGVDKLSPSLRQGVKRRRLRVTLKKHLKAIMIATAIYVTSCVCSLLYRYCI